MCEQFLNRFGFIHADSECLEECKDNPLIIPRLYRYLGMGHFEILANVKDVPDKYFLFEVAGSNGYETIANHDALNKLTEADAISLKQLNAKLQNKSWTSIVGIEHFDNVDINTVSVHLPSEESY